MTLLQAVISSARRPTKARRQHTSTTGRFREIPGARKTAGAGALFNAGGRREHQWPEERADMARGVCQKDDPLLYLTP